MQSCPLCTSRKAQPLVFIKEQSFYFRCDKCDLIFLDPLKRLSPAEEEHRYRQHNNDVEDRRYQEFVSPLVQIIQARHSKGAHGLDFGAGTGPVLARLLGEQGFTVDLYDPYFWPDRTSLEKQFDFIVSSEVFEHLYHPDREISVLRSKLKEKGTLAIMTSLTDGVSFENWYYRRDPTHACFYSSITMQWIKDHFHFSKMKLESARSIWFET